MASCIETDVIEHIYKIINDKAEKLPRFFPVILPRRFGKTTITKRIKEEFGHLPLKVIDNFERVSIDRFWTDIIPWFRTPGNIVVVLFTMTDEDHYTTKFKYYPCYRVCMNLENHDYLNTVDITFPDGTTITKTIDCMTSHKKENEISNIFKLLNTPIP